MANSLNLLQSNERWLEDMIKCPVCHNIYEEPRQLPCGHNLCKRCLLQCHNFNVREDINFVHCPECRMFLILTEAPTEQKCFTLCNIVEDYKKSIQQDDEAAGDFPSSIGNSSGKPLFQCQTLLEFLFQLYDLHVQKQQVKDGFFTSVAIVLFIFGLIGGFHANRVYSENNKLTSTALTQRTQLQELFHFLSDGACFHPSSPPEEVYSESIHSVNFLTLDLDSSSPFLRVSLDLMSVERVEHKLSLPPHPSRFRETPQILTHQCFSYGRHYWEVMPEGVWDIAVSYKAIKRNIKDFFGYNKNSWSLTKKDNSVLAVYHNRTKIVLSKPLKYEKVAVAVDFQEGSISFLEIGEEVNLLHKFQSQLTQPVCLGFGLYKSNPPSRITILKRPSFP